MPISEIFCPPCTTHRPLIGREITKPSKFIFHAREDRSVELLKERMSSEGWSYVQQEGSNYFFEKGNGETIVTVQQWNHKYIIYQVKDNVINIAD
ncbi:hypothetical protein C172_11321 [Paenibacillus sp. FSL H8-457]|nr:hypothetical protein C172_11321 [Paenibacillus sp. FSL H8-457]